LTTLLSDVDELIISRVPLFQNLPAVELAFLARTLQPRQFPAGQLLFREGERGNRFFILRQGQVEVIKALGSPNERLIGVRGPGEYVGEMSLFNPSGLRSATVRTRTPVDALEMTRADFDALLARRPTLAYEMVRVLSLRLDEAHTRTIRDLSDKNRQLTEAYHALQAAQAGIIQKEKLEHELRVARDVQASLLPQAVPTLPGWEFAASWLPARQVSGDFYDFIPPVSAGAAGQLACEGCWGLVIADVSDKGMPAALFMALTRSIVRASVVGPGSPVELIAQANRLVCADAAQGMFVTLFYGLLDPAAASLTYVNAGHDPPWHFQAASGQWTELTPTGMALGFFDGAPFAQRTVPVEPGDTLVLFTDGITDAESPERERFGRDRLGQVFQERRGQSAAELAAAIITAHRQFCGDAPLFDDVTLVVVRRGPAP
jgi:serine phosphatase RsbU (regulator of sigma subunit)